VELDRGGPRSGSSFPHEAPCAGASEPASNRRPGTDGKGGWTPGRRNPTSARWLPLLALDPDDADALLEVLGAGAQLLEARRKHVPGIARDVGLALARVVQGGRSRDSSTGVAQGGPVVLLTYDEAAQLGRCSKKKIQRLVSSGRLPVTRHGRQPLVPVAPLLEVLSCR
jgi:excisionase family DNA binding protein